MARLYEDKYCNLTSESLEIYSYYFPFGSKIIPLSTIKKISHMKGGVYRISGSGDFIHWWAGDFSRFGTAESPRGYVMITVENESIIKCFTSEHVEELLSLIRGQIPGVIREDRTSMWG